MKQEWASKILEEFSKTEKQTTPQKTVDQKIPENFKQFKYQSRGNTPIYMLVKLLKPIDKRKSWRQPEKKRKITSRETKNYSRFLIRNSVSPNHGVTLGKYWNKRSCQYSILLPEKISLKMKGEQKGFLRQSGFSLNNCMSVILVPHPYQYLVFSFSLVILVGVKL